jgi:general secretion pathway protein J
MREAGFTLIEMLVTVALLALVAMLLFGGLRFGARAWDGAQAHGAGSEEVRLVQDTLRRELESAYPRYDASDTLHPQIDFAGEPDGVRFLSHAPQALQTAGYTHIALAEEPDGKDRQLTIHVGDGSSALLRHIAGVRFAYFDGASWSDDWRAAALPRLVRIRVVFRRGDARLWPDLIVAPQIAVDTGCIYDVSANRCAGRS